jgi:GNAT superfamily N-acetyltransferase
MSDGVSIRPVRAGDGSALAGAWIEFGHYYASRDPIRFRSPEASGLAEWFESRIDQAHDLWFVAERSGAIVGFLEGQLLPPPDDADRLLMKENAEPSLMVTTLFVTEAERNHGVGRLLMRAAEEWGRERGATSAAVIAIADSPSAVPFYEAMAYRPNTIGFWKTL